MIRYVLLASIPISVALNYGLDASPIWIFAASAIAIGVLADWIRRATDQLAEQVGPAIGGLLTVSFGSIAELVLAIFVLLRGEAAVVQAQITGSIIGTSLFGLGLAILVGGATRDRQRFRPERAGLLSTMLILTVVAMLLPAVFDVTLRITRGSADLAISDEELSLGVSVVLLLLYAANLIFTLVTHRDVFASEEATGRAEWSLATALIVLVGATAVVAVESEMLSGALTETASALRLSPMFVGIIVLGLLGTSADLFAASWFAHQDKMGLVLNICIGSAIQVALVLAPVLVIVSWLLGRPMNLVFSNPLHLFAIASTAFVVSAVARDGETTWFEGLLLVGVYALFALSFYFVPT